MEELVPGWYPDPAKNADTYRWWTGAAWTDQLANDPTAPPPGAQVPLRVVPPGEPPRRPLRRWAAMIGSTALVLIFLVAVIVGDRVQAPIRELGSGPIPSGPAPTAATPFQVDELTLRFGDVAVGRMPGPPFDRPAKADGIYGLLTNGTASATLTSPGGSGRTPWYANVVAGWVETDLSAPTPDGVARAVVAAIPDLMFTQVSTKTIDIEVGAVEGFETDVAARLTARITYSDPTISSTHDDVVIIIVRTDPVNYAVWLSAVPDGAPDDVVAAVRAAERALVPA